MGDEAANSVLRRKTGNGARAAPEKPVMTPEKALRVAAARAGDEALSVPVSARALTLKTDTPETLSDDLPDPALIALIEDGDGFRGLAVICPQAVAATIEALTLGLVSPGEAAMRQPTATDAAMMADFLNGLLDLFGALAATCPDLPPIDGFHYVRRLPDARAGGMALADAPHLSCTAELDFGLGAKTGKIVLIFPRDRRAAPETGIRDAAWADTLQRSVLATEARLEAVLCRLRRPLADITGLAVGDLVPLGSASLDGLSLLGPNGRKVVAGKLGRSGAMRAVRVQIAPPAAAPQAKPALQAADKTGTEPASDPAADPAAKP